MKSGRTEHLGSFITGQRELLEAVGLSPELLVKLKGRAQFFLDGGHEERAFLMLEMLTALDGNDHASSLVTAELLLRRGYSAGAQARVERVLEREPENSDALVLLAEIKMELGELPAAAAMLRSVLATPGAADTDSRRRARALCAKGHTLFAHGHRLRNTG